MKWSCKYMNLLVCSSFWFLSNGADECSLFPRKIWTLAHHAVYYNAPINVIERILESLSILVYLCDEDNKLPVDYLSPDASHYICEFSSEKLLNIQKNFHAIIMKRAGDLVEKNHLVLPNISVLLSEEFDDEIYFAIPGMYGGFNFKLEWNSEKTEISALITESWSRVCGGSGQRHRCTEIGFTLEEEGFV